MFLVYWNMAVANVQAKYRCHAISNYHDDSTVMIYHASLRLHYSDQTICYQRRKRVQQLEFSYWGSMPQSDPWTVCCQFGKKTNHVKMRPFVSVIKIDVVKENATDASKMNFLVSNNRLISWVTFTACKEYHIVCLITISRKVKCLKSISLCPFYKHGLTLTLAWISNYIHSKV